MMKTSDLAAAVSLLLQGYLRANDEADLPKAEQDKLLARGISAARQELSDWAENLDGAPAEVQAIAARGAL